MRAREKQIPVRSNVSGEKFELPAAGFEGQAAGVGEHPAEWAAGAKAEIRKAETLKLNRQDAKSDEPGPRLPDGNGLQHFQSRRPAGGMFFWFAAHAGRCTKQEIRRA